MLTKYHFETKHISNIDESVCATVQVSSAIVTLKGKKQVESITSGERGKSVSAVYAFCAAGSIAPPMIIFLEKIIEIISSRVGQSDQSAVILEQFG